MKPKPGGSNSFVSSGANYEFEIYKMNNFPYFFYQFIKSFVYMNYIKWI